MLLIFSTNLIHINLMINNLRIIIIVIMRLLALYFIAMVFLSVLFMILLGTGSGSGFSLGAIFIPVIKAMLLWGLARPCADVVTNGIDE